MTNTYRIDPQLLRVAKIRLENDPEILSELVEVLEDPEKGRDFRDYLQKRRAVFSADPINRVDTSAWAKILLSFVDTFKQLIDAKQRVERGKKTTSDISKNREKAEAPPKRNDNAEAATWQLIKPVSPRGYIQPLFEFMKQVQDEGQPIPTPSDVMKAWKEKPPAGYKISVSDNLRELTYEDGGKMSQKTVDRAVLQQAINRRTGKTPLKKLIK